MTSNNIMKIQELIEIAIKNNNIEEFKSILINNNISINDINVENFDILIFAIKNETSFDFIKYIIPLYQSLNYYISVDKYRYTSPLFAAIDAKSISIISLLLKHGENINFKIGGEANIDIEMFYQNCLQSHMTNEIQERKILKYLLNYGLSPSLDFVDVILKDTKYNSLLKLLFEYNFFSIYNTSFILNFLLIYKGQEPLSHSKLKSILLERNSKFIVKKKWFQGESLFKNDIALQILCRYT